ncbi:GGDEF domain-containing protein [Pseudohongiella spirulinae]|uniref:GGDEF domain-containing protein n=1 Tax=Pseudohongiella spirulinae TaxID=1249552 RepID=UPI000717859D|nr:GGDEF domain-containing protein [Pseudohongiella spirulinae]
MTEPVPRDNTLQCPVGELQCLWLDELSQLRDKVAALSELVITDELTGLFNYRFLIRSINQELERAHRVGQGFALAILDFDNFKRLNDTHGHEFGNQVLRAAGTYIRKSLRQLDVPCRFGGEEFVIVLPGTSLREAVVLGERLREGIAAIRLVSDGQRVDLSVSIGIDYCGPADHLTADQAIARADKYLLQAKASGKNQVCHAPLSERAAGTTKDERDALLESFSARRR